MTVITIIGYNNSSNTTSRHFTCGNVASYTSTTTITNNSGDYGCKYLNCNSYIHTYTDRTVRVTKKVTGIRHRLYNNYNTYIETYPEGIVRLIPGSTRIIILYGSPRGNTTIHGIYAGNYVNYEVYIGGTTRNTIRISKFLTHMGCTRPFSNRTTLRGYPAGYLEESMWVRFLGGVFRFENNTRIRKRGRLYTSIPLGGVSEPGHLVLSLSRRLNTPTGTVMGPNSRLVRFRYINRTINMVSTPIRAPFTNAIGRVVAASVTSKHDTRTVMVSISSSSKRRGTTFTPVIS